MSDAPPPVFVRYQSLLGALRRGEGDQTALLKRVSELISLLDLSLAMSSGRSFDAAIESALLVLLAELGASRGCIFIRQGDGQFRIRASRGMNLPEPRDYDLRGLESGRIATGQDDPGHADLLRTLALNTLCPVVRNGATLAVLGIGPRLDQQPLDEDAYAFLHCVAACAETLIENGLNNETMGALNARLSRKVFELDSLFDLNRELAASFDEEAIKNVALSTAMGHLLVTRCALLLDGPGGLYLAHQKGLRGDLKVLSLQAAESKALFKNLGRAASSAAMPDGPLKAAFTAERLTHVVPLSLGGGIQGLLALSDRPNGKPLGAEDYDYLYMLGRQTLAAIENVRLHQMRIEKLRQDRELEIAREIQQSLFPPAFKRVPGWDFWAETRSCRQVGGDYYDVLHLESGRMAAVIADVSGKGPPASILMASVHAFIHALAGTVDLTELVQRLNRFLYTCTQTNRFVTFLILDFGLDDRKIRYINAGHVPPFWFRARGRADRLESGGPALGVIDAATFEIGHIEMTRGERLVLVTDGVTEARTPDDQEFGDERVIALQGRCDALDAERHIGALLAAVSAWEGAAGCSDDLTALVLRAC
ncbi:MAG: SpoIIE family protein phosphatase [Vicinamibacteria bacterium]|jgi:sigma-B regulation protein RsbU (phosphoserine phosphatase)|nr:SpoIIE family protein phosphatase [Vicinamibacteria bacterium]